MADVSGGSERSGLYGKNPPKPNLTLRVGISGHRPKDKSFPLAATDRVKRQLREVFDTIDRVLENLKDENRDFYAHGGDKTVRPAVRLVSGLAEGADQMAVDARPPGWELDAVLPFPEQDYLADFTTSARDRTDVTAGFVAARKQATTVVELPRDPRLAAEEPADETEKQEYWRVRNQAYARLGRFLLGQVDVLVAVWDGTRAEGPGGTAEVVRGALDAGIPVIWISTVEDIHPRMVGAVDADDRAVALPADDLGEALEKAIATIVSVPTAGAGTLLRSHDHHDAKERLRTFFAETWPPPTRAVLYDMFRRWIDGKPLRSLIKPEPPERYAGAWDGFLDEAPIPAAAQADPDERRNRFTRRVRETLLPRFAWADALAVERSHRYRSAYIACYLLAILLAAIALFGVFAHDWFHDHDAMLLYKALLVASEFGLIVLIVGIVRLGTRRRWLERWMEYRALAEMLRSAGFLSLLGEHGYIQRSHDLEPASSAWFLWYVRATTRELGLPYAQLDQSYQDKVLGAVETHVIDDQLAYNRPIAKSLAEMHHRLHQAGNFCFFLTAAILLAFVAAYLVYAASGLGGEGVAPWREHLKEALAGAKSYVTFFAAFLPAVGAALYGIRETGDFEGFSDRAVRTADKLQALKLAVARARQKPDLETTTAVLLAAAQVLSEDLGAWQSVYGCKQLNLPA